MQSIKHQPKYFRGIFASTVLDKLVDEMPEELQSVPLTHTAQLTQIRQSIRFELETLLNTRQPVHSEKADLTELKDSLFSYGMIDSVFQSADDEGSFAELLSEITQRIRENEPRLSALRVTLLHAPRHGERYLHLLIEGEFRYDDVVTPVQFETSIEPSTQRFVVGDDNE